MPKPPVGVKEKRKYHQHHKALRKGQDIWQQLRYVSGSGKKRSEAKHFTPGESADTPLGPGVVSYQVESPTPTLEDTELRLTTDVS